MTDLQQRVERAIRLTPRAERERYAAEWRSDLAGAEGPEQAEVARAATRMAVRLQVRRVERTLLGRSGAPSAVTGWVVLILLLVAAGLLGGPVLLLAVLVLAGVAITLTHAGAPSHWTHWIAISSLAIAFAGLAYAFWAIGANVDAEDSFTTAPAAAGYAGVGLLVFLVSVLALIAAAAAAAARESRIRNRPR